MSARKPLRNGKLASMPTGKLLSKPAISPELERLLRAVYPEFQKLDSAQEDRRGKADFVFHMTDWAEDLEQLANLYRHPERFTRPEAEAIVSGFLYHVIPHLNEAGRLLLDYEPGKVFDSR